MLKRWQTFENPPYGISFVIGHVFLFREELNWEVKCLEKCAPVQQLWPETGEELSGYIRGVNL